MKGKESKVENVVNKKFHIIAISICKIELRMRVLEVVGHDEFCLQAKEEFMKTQECKNYEGYRLEESNLLVYKERLYILDSAYFWKIVMDEFHQSTYSSFHGYHKTIIVARKLYYFPDKKKDVVE